MLTRFGAFSGFKINLAKTEAIPGTPTSKFNTMSGFPFKWSPNGFNYLGVSISSSLKQMYTVGKKVLCMSRIGPGGRTQVQADTRMGLNKIFIKHGTKQKVKQYSHWGKHDKQNKNQN